MKKFLRLFSRFLIFLPAAIIQVLFYIVLFSFLKDYILVIQMFLFIYQLIVIIYLLNARFEANYKTLWILIISSFPIFGSYLYLISGNRKTGRILDSRINKNTITLSNSNKSDDLTLNLINNLSHMPINNIESVKYYKLGDLMYDDLINDLKNAKHFIFLEYFIIEKGYFWDSIVEVLKEKVKEGVMVKILFDDIGSISTYSIRSKNQLRKLGIDIIAFNPLINLNLTLNNRDHRKMTIIDNYIVYSGGINIADEYINKINRFGIWKDTAFRATGEIALSFSAMFTSFFNSHKKNKIDFNSLYKPPFTKTINQSISYYDSPGFNEAISNKYLINILGQAKKYVYIFTPYLIVGDSLKEAIILATLKGIDVKIIIPGIPDKKSIYLLSRKYANMFIKYGVNMYIYNEGFIHAKSVVCDDEIVSIGTVNLDYRSLYLHYECNTIFKDKNLILDVKNDFLETLEKSTKLEYKKEFFLKRIFTLILDIFSPLL